MNPSVIDPIKKTYSSIFFSNDLVLLQPPDNMLSKMKNRFAYAAIV